MSTVIETGKTVEEALEKALVALGRSVDEVDYEVLEQLGDDGGREIDGVRRRKRPAPVLPCGGGPAS